MTVVVECGECGHATDVTNALATADNVYATWLDAIQHAFLLAKSQRLAEIRADRRTKRFDARGLHPVSVEWGKVFACENLLPGLTELRDVGGDPCDPVSLDRLAQEAARVAFVEELAERGEGAWTT